MNIDKTCLSSEQPKYCTILSWWRFLSNSISDFRAFTSCRWKKQIEEERERERRHYLLRPVHSFPHLYTNWGNNNNKRHYYHIVQEPLWASQKHKTVTWNTWTVFLQKCRFKQMSLLKVPWKSEGSQLGKYEQVHVGCSKKRTCKGNWRLFLPWKMWKKVVCISRDFPAERWEWGTSHCFSQCMYSRNVCNFLSSTSSSY